MKSKTEQHIERTGSGLREMLFQEFENLVAGKGSPNRARAAAAIATAIVKSAELDIHYHRYIIDLRKEMPDVPPVLQGPKLVTDKT